MIEQLQQEIAELQQVSDRLYSSLNGLGRLIERKRSALKAVCTHTHVVIEHYFDGHKNKQFYKCRVCAKDLPHVPEGSQTEHKYD